MSTAVPPAAGPTQRLRWYRYRLQTLLVAVLLVSVGISALAMYYRPARLDNDVLFAACTCGLKRAKISHGEVALLEPNHATTAGSIVATIELANGKCVVRWLKVDGTIASTESCEIDHLGAKYYDDRFHGNVYVILVDDWKLYPFGAWQRIRSWFG
jgi:hypothetical protein